MIYKITYQTGLQYWRGQKSQIKVEAESELKAEFKFHDMGLFDGKLLATTLFNIISIKPTTGDDHDR